jgi:hypothetical protein
VFHGFSARVVPRPGDWRRGLDVTGYWWPYDREDRLPAEVLDFLDAGPAPVFVGLGSATVPDAARFGSNPNGKIFAQFKTGSTYVYSQVPDDVRAEMERATSIGSFIAQLIVKPKLYPSVKYSDRLVKLEKQVEDGQYNAVDQWL